MNNLRILDVTLRDGGCVNNFNFGQTYMERILAAQEAAGIDIIEIGYIDENKGSVKGRTQYINEKVIPQCILKNKKSNIKYVVMIDYGKFDIDKLEPRNDKGIDGIRLAFHKKDRFNIIDIGKKILALGYEFYIQPMVTLRYTDAELLELIDLVNKELPDASGFYIVDSFGEMRANDMNRVLNLVDHNLISSMTLGFHSHNNLQMSYSNSIAMIQFETTRNMIIDSSIMGMGKGAGNLNTEIFVEHLNLFYGKNYNISPLLQVIDEVINPIHSEMYWGYSVEYYLSAINHCTPSYASYFYNKNMLPINQLSSLLESIAPHKKVSFDQKYAEALYISFNEKNSVDDTETVCELKKVFSNKLVLLIAPGKSINNHINKINALIADPNIISIGLNVIDRNADYVMTTRKEIFDMAIVNNFNVITTSNVFIEKKERINVLNYKDWIITKDRVIDSSFAVIGKLLKEVGVKKMLLAGFDGFQTDINLNYYSDIMRRPIIPNQVEINNQMNKYIVEFLREAGIELEFVTPSIYEMRGGDNR